MIINSNGVVINSVVGGLKCYIVPVGFAWFILISWLVQLLGLDSYYSSLLHSCCIFYFRADNLVTRYPNYEVEVGGVGPGPPGTEHLGCSTQIAIFFRKGGRAALDDIKCEVSATTNLWAHIHHLTLNFQYITYAFHLLTPLHKVACFLVCPITNSLLIHLGVSSSTAVYFNNQLPWAIFFQSHVNKCDNSLKFILTPAGNLQVDPENRVSVQGPNGAFWQQCKVLYWQFHPIVNRLWTVLSYRWRRTSNSFLPSGGICQWKSPMHRSWRQVKVWNFSDSLFQFLVGVEWHLSEVKTGLILISDRV